MIIINILELLEKIILCNFFKKLKLKLGNMEENILQPFRHFTYNISNFKKFKKYFIYVI